MNIKFETKAEHDARVDLALKRIPRKCERCNTYRADPPSRLCQGCEAYREHLR